MSCGTWTVISAFCALCSLDAAGDATVLWRRFCHRGSHPLQLYGLYAPRLSVTKGLVPVLHYPTGSFTAQRTTRPSTLSRPIFCPWSRLMSMMMKEEEEEEEDCYSGI
jgi:hypothetical protein